VSPGAARGIRVGVSVVLAAAAVATFAFIYDFGQHRFFTVDEYQYGHATWLLTQGQRPYVDFYEHHFPLSYLLSAPLLPDSGSFADRALLLRRIAFGYLLVAALALAVCGRRATGDTKTAWLLAILPFGFGFGLMSEVDYRADNMAACLMVVCLALLDANRTARKRALAAAAGVVFALAAFMTQKMVLLGGGAIAALLAVDAVRRRIRGSTGPPFLAFPVVFSAMAAAVGVVLLGVGIAWGLLPAAWETTILHTIEHEAYYREMDFWQYAKPFLAETRWSTAAIAICAASVAVFRRGGFWLIPLAVALAGNAAMKAPYPYNFVYPGYLLSICAVLGFGQIVGALRRWRDSPWLPLLYLLPLAVLPDQIGFVAGRSTNAHQLQLLRKIEAYSTPQDAVIDGAGGALFRNHGSYYWYHGNAHRQMFHDYFVDDLVADYRRSAALFWIHDFRQQELPDRVRSYFARHYVHVDGDLYVLGFATPATGNRAHERAVDILRAGDYVILEMEEHAGRRRLAPAAADHARLLHVGDRAGSDGRIRIEVGRRPIRVEPGAPAFLVTPLPFEAFDETIGRGSVHSPLFEFEKPTPSEGAG